MDRPVEVRAGDGLELMMGLEAVDHAYLDVRTEADTTLGRVVATKCRRWAFVMTSMPSAEPWRAVMESAGMVFHDYGFWIEHNYDDDRLRWSSVTPVVIMHGAMVERREPKHSPVWQTRRGQRSLRSLYELLVIGYSEQGEMWCEPRISDPEARLAQSALLHRRCYLGWHTDLAVVDRANQIDIASITTHGDEEPASMSRSHLARVNVDKSILGMLSIDHGIVRSELAQRLDLTWAEIKSSLRRLQKQALVRREGRTSDSLYYRIDPQAQGKPS